VAYIHSAHTRPAVHPTRASSERTTINTFHFNPLSLRPIPLHPTPSSLPKPSPAPHQGSRPRFAPAASSPPPRRPRQRRVPTAHTQASAPHESDVSEHGCQCTSPTSSPSTSQPREYVSRQHLLRRHVALLRGLTQLRDTQVHPTRATSVSTAVYVAPNHPLFTPTHQSRERGLPTPTNQTSSASVWVLLSSDACLHPPQHSIATITCLRTRGGWEILKPAERRGLDPTVLPFLRHAALRDDWRKVGVRADHPTSRKGGG
jgi:hypothetical protein